MNEPLLEWNTEKSILLGQETEAQRGKLSVQGPNLNGNRAGQESKSLTPLYFSLI